MLRRNSKGKEKATEKTDILLSPSFSIADSDDEDDEPAGGRGPPHILTDEPEEDEHQASDPSPTILSKSWVEEEGEIFRRGNVLLRPDELEEGGIDISSEELKREVIDPFPCALVLRVSDYVRGSSSRPSWNVHGQDWKGTMSGVAMTLCVKRIYCRCTSVFTLVLMDALNRNVVVYCVLLKFVCLCSSDSHVLFVFGEYRLALRNISPPFSVAPFPAVKLDFNASLDAAQESRSAHRWLSQELTHSFEPRSCRAAQEKGGWQGSFQEACARSYR